MSNTDQSILWRRLDQPGHESARLFFRDSLWHLSGTAVFAHDGKPCRLDYLVVCDSQWQTQSGKVTGWVGNETIEIELSVDSVRPNGASGTSKEPAESASGGVGGLARRWRLNGAERPEAAGCIDLDLNFSPSTNVLPIRRVGLIIGEEANVQAAWLRFPSFALERLEQIYRRIDEKTYRYESAGGKFVTELEVNAAGLVTRYPNFWQEE